MEILNQSIPCQTCGGTVALISRRRRDFACEMIASCHGMNLVRIACTPADVSSVAAEFLSSASRIRRSIPEDNMDGGQRVTHQTHVEVGESRVKLFTIGGTFNIDGKIGRVTGKTKGGRVTLSP